MVLTLVVDKRLSREVYVGPPLSFRNLSTSKPKSRDTEVTRSGEERPNDKFTPVTVGEESTTPLTSFHARTITVH